MPATSNITFINECRSLGSEQHAEERDTLKRIPRPPNAFMLYRSDFLKRRAIPPEVEKRQQNLSRIAGQCWNMLPETEKAIWYGKAAVVRAEHRARHVSHKTGPFHKDTNKLLAMSKRRGSVTSSGRSLGRSRTRRTRSPYCEGMFAALRSPNHSSPVSQASLVSPTPASESPLSIPASLSPLSLPYLLPPFTSHPHSSWQDSPPVNSENSIVWRNKFGYLLDPSGSETPQWDLCRFIRGLDITQKMGTSQEPRPSLQHYEDSSATCVPYDNSVAQVALTLPGSNAFSPAIYYLADCRPSANDFGVTDGLAHFNQSLAPLYPRHSDELNPSGVVRYQ